MTLSSAFAEQRHTNRPTSAAGNASGPEPVKTTRAARAYRTHLPLNPASIPVHPRAGRPIEPSHSASFNTLLLLQRKLAIGATSDPLEAEADRVADQVMGMAAPSPQVKVSGAEPAVRRKCACEGSGSECPECQKKKEEKLQRKARSPLQPQSPAPVEAPQIVHNVLRSPGQQLDAATRAFFEPRFGADFSRVRVHTDERAADSARSVDARAYTVGSHIVFGADQFAPHSTSGRRLIAHELGHTLQQAQPAASVSAGVLQRQQAQGQSGNTSHANDPRLEDPNFLLCLALCYLGIPPGIWRSVVNQVLQAVSAEYHARYGEQRGSAEFESWRAGLTTWSAFNILKFVLVFLGESKIGPIVIQNATARAIRQRILDWLLVRGVEAASVEVAAQVIRKVAIFIEAAWAAGCAVYCGATAAANAIIEFTSNAISAISSFVTALSQVGAALAQAITRPILVAQITMNPANWDVSALPTRSRAHLNAIGLAFRLAFTPDAFLTSMARPLSSFNIPGILGELAQDINATLQSRGGFVAAVTFTPQFIGGLTPIQFIDILKDYGLLRFRQDPEQLADQQLSTANATP